MAPYASVPAALASSPVFQPPHPPRVLVVDTSDANRRAVVRMLRAAGMDVAEALSGKEAIEFARAEQPQLVVLDITLPDIMGYDVVRLLKHDARTHAIPVLYLTASHVGSADRAYGLEAGADGYLTHPVDPSVLLATVRALLRIGEADAQLRAAAQEWQATFDTITDAIVLLDEHGVVRRSNRAARVLFAEPGASSEEPDDIVGVPVQEVMGASAFVGLLGRDPAGIAPVHALEWQFAGRWFSVSIDRVNGPCPTTLKSVVCVFHDITDRKRHLDERERLLVEAEAARLEAESANRAKAQFLATMSHELRTPLNAIGGYADLLEMEVRGPVLPEQRMDLLRIKRSQEHLLGLINDLLSFAKIERGVVEFHTTTFSLVECVQMAGEFVTPQMRDKAIRYEFVPRDTLHVTGDHDKLQQILLNLLSNAVKFTPANGTITLTCGAMRMANGVSGFFVSVHDTGDGIRAEELHMIFEPFVQVDQRLKREYGGVGLGLAISRELARGMGGDLVVESVVNVGSTFTLMLPMTFVTDARTPRDVAPTPQRELELEPTLDAPQRRNTDTGSDA